MKKILITAPTRQDPKIFKEYLWSLNRLEIPEGYEVYKYFYLHNSKNLIKFLKPNEYEIFNDNSILEESNKTHIWKNDNFSAVSKMRTMALEKARNEKYDYIFSVDTDVILHKMTLCDLLAREKDIISKIYWTAWNSDMPWNFMPNCYDGKKRNGTLYYNDGIQKYKIIGTYTTNVTGAAILISSKIFNNPLINYYPIEILSTSYWEDYAFCTKCKCIYPDLQIYIDTIHPAKHLYRKEDYEKWIKDEKEKWKNEF